MFDEGSEHRSSFKKGLFIYLILDLEKFLNALGAEKVFDLKMSQCIMVYDL